MHPCATCAVPTIMAVGLPEGGRPARAGLIFVRLPWGSPHCSPEGIPDPPFLRLLTRRSHFPENGKGGHGRLWSVGYYRAIGGSVYFEASVSRLQPPALPGQASPECRCSCEGRIPTRVVIPGRRRCSETSSGHDMFHVNPFHRSGEMKRMAMFHVNHFLPKRHHVFHVNQAARLSGS